MTDNEENRSVRFFNKKANGFFSIIPSWFVAITTFVYITGYLIVSIHSESLGASDISGDYIKAKYIQVGIYYLLFPICILVPCWHFHKIRVALKVNKFNNPIIKILYDFIAIFSVMNLFVVFIIIATIAPQGYYKKHALEFISLILLAGIVQIIISLKEIFKKSQVSYKYLREILFITIVLIDIIALKDIYKTLFHALCQGITYYLLIAFIGYFVWSYFNNKLDPKLNLSRFLFISGRIVALYYISVVAFAYSLYTFIPAYKNGGALNPSKVILYFDKKFENTIPEQLLAEEGTGKGKNAPSKYFKSKELFVLAETSNVLYVIDPVDINLAKEQSQLQPEYLASKKYGIRRDVIAVKVSLNTN